MEVGILEKNIKITYSSTNEKTIDEVIKKLIEVHMKVKRDNKDSKKATNR